MRNKKSKRTAAQVADYYGMNVRPRREDETDEQYYKALAKQADQRLVRLEKLSTSDEFSGVLDFAYRKAMYDIQSLSGDPNATRFNRVLRKTQEGTVDKRVLHARINAIKRFLESASSTKQGIQKVYQERVNTLNKRLNTNYTWQQMAKYYENEKAQKLVDKYDSKTVLKTFAAIKTIVTPEEINKSLSKDVNVSEDKIVNEIAKTILAEGITFDDIFN